MGFWYFLRKRNFYLHLLLSIVLSMILLWGVLKSLDVFTRHGEVYLVPDFEGQSINGLTEKGFVEYFSFKVVDSVYFKSREKGTVVMQNPLPGAKVKKGRHVYLTIVAQLPEKVLMPNLKNLSLRQALVTLESKGLEVGELNYIQYFARNAVIDQLLDEEPIEPDTEITKGTVINLVLGKGSATVKVPLPNLMGLDQQQANSVLHYNSLNVGKEYFLEGFDPIHSRVYKTDPEVLSEESFLLGERVNLWYRSDEFFNFDKYIKQFKVDSLRSDTIVYNNYRVNDEQ